MVYFSCVKEPVRKHSLPALRKMIIFFERTTTLVVEIMRDISAIVYKYEPNEGGTVLSRKKCYFGVSTEF